MQSYQLVTKRTSGLRNSSSEESDKLFSISIA